jgi:hypothetical protein
MALPRRRTPQQDEGRPAGAPGADVDWHALYEIENPAEVDAYVRRYPFLVPILIKAPDHIARHFGAHCGLVLEAPIFPDDGTQHLYLLVRTADPFDEVVAHRDQLDEQWWLDAMVEARSCMTIDVEFV